MRPNLEDQEIISALAKVVGRKIDPVVLEALYKQNKVSGALPDAKKRSLESLQENPLVVVTGQQVGLFGGPLLTLYKAITTLKVAEHLSGKLGCEVIPIFWLQSEDHDIEEISYTTVIGPDNIAIRISLPTEKGRSNKISVAKVKFEDSISTAISELLTSLSLSSDSSGLFSLISEVYRPGNTWNESFLELFKAIFQNSKMLFLDVESDGIKQTLVFKNTILTALNLSAEIEGRLNESTLQNGITNGVQIKSSSPLFFLSSDSGDRYRLTQASEQYLAPNGEQFSLSHIRKLIELEPARFSTSALLRPIVQDALLPNLAYVGGDSEMMYHRQLDAVYSLFGIPLPALVPRAKFNLLSAKTAQILNDLGLGTEELAKTDDEVAAILRTRGLKFGLDTNSLLASVTENLEKVAEPLVKAVNELDPTLQDPLLKAKQNAIRGFEQFIGKLKKAAYTKDEVILKKISRVRSLLYPFGKVQERELGLIYVLAKVGPSIIEKLQASISVFDGKRVNLTLDEL